MLWEVLDSSSVLRWQVKIISTHIINITNNNNVFKLYVDNFIVYPQQYLYSTNASGTKLMPETIPTGQRQTSWLFTSMKLRTTVNKSSQWSEQDLNSGPPKYKSTSALTTQPHCFLPAPGPVTTGTKLYVRGT